MCITFTLSYYYFYYHCHQTAHIPSVVSQTLLQQSPTAVQASPIARQPPHRLSPSIEAEQTPEQHSAPVVSVHVAPSSSPQVVVMVVVVVVVVEVVVLPALHCPDVMSQSLLQQSALVVQASAVAKHPPHVNPPLGPREHACEQHSIGDVHVSPSSSPQEVVVVVVVVVEVVVLPALHCAVVVSQSLLQQSAAVVQVSAVAKHPPHVSPPLGPIVHSCEQHSAPVGSVQVAPSSSPQEVVVGTLVVVVSAENYFLYRSRVSHCSPWMGLE